MTLNVGVLAVDRVKPTIGMTSPANGSNISGTITIAASAVDNDAVARVQFQVDGANYGAPVTAAPWQIAGFNTHSLTPGAHTFGAIATDRVGNVSALSQVSATVAQSVPAPGTVLLGNLLTWDGEQNAFVSQRSGPEPWDGTGTSQGDWHWSATGDRTTPVHLPANPDPANYQMRAWFVWSRVEPGSSGNNIYIDAQIGAAARFTAWTWPGDSYAGQKLIGNVNGGESFLAWRWCTIVGMNSSFAEGIGLYYDFVPKGPSFDIRPERGGAMRSETTEPEPTEPEPTEPEPTKPEPTDE